MDVQPRLPEWAEDAGISPPAVNEPFVDYWLRVGVPADIIDRACQVRPGAEVVANERLVAWLHRQIPNAFDAHLTHLLAQHGMPAPPPWTPPPAPL